MAKKTTPRAPTPVVIDRTNEVQRLLLEGRTRSYILQSTSDWGLDERTVDEYVRRAWTRIKEVNKTSLEEKVALVTAELWDIARTAKQSGDGHLAVKAIAQLAKIQGLEQMTVNHILRDERELEKVSDDDLDAAIAIEAEYESV